MKYIHRNNICVKFWHNFRPPMLKVYSNMFWSLKNNSEKSRLRLEFLCEMCENPKEDEWNWNASSICACHGWHGVGTYRINVSEIFSSDVCISFIDASRHIRIYMQNSELRASDICMKWKWYYSSLCANVLCINL